MIQHVPRKILTHFQSSPHFKACKHMFTLSINLFDDYGTSGFPQFGSTGAVFLFFFVLFYLESAFSSRRPYMTELQLS